MSRVLIWKRVFPGSEYDIFNDTDYTQLWDHVQTQWNGNPQNWGNKLWFQGIYSAVDTEENEYGFLGNTINVEEINREYDFIILPMANIFHKDFLCLMQALTDHLEKIRIPVYVVACGIQTDHYDCLNDLVQEIGADSARFMKAVYNTGGEFALRGYYTKEFFDRLGFHSAVVTGCPSLYQLGPDFTVDDQKCDPTKLLPVFSGNVRQYEQLLRKNASSVFMDQDAYFAPLFQPDFLQKPTFRFQMNYANNYGIVSARLLSEGRIIMAADMNDWSNYLKHSGFNYSFGSRIHGTIMALLSGVPATIITLDARTEEMASFFDIPHVSEKHSHIFSEREFHELYEKMDYSHFNRTFQDKFSVYETFLRKHGIVSHVNTHNRFFTDKQPNVFNGSDERKNAFSDFAFTLERNERFINIGNAVRTAIRGN